jgi:CHAD domain-containing protein
MSDNGKEQTQLLKYLDEMVDKLRTLVPLAAQDGDESAIHHARVATRRLHAAMEVFKPISSKTHRREFTKVLSRLRKNLGPARDLDVMIERLNELNASRHQAGVEWMKAQLLQKQSEARQATSAEIDVAKILSRLGAWWGVRQEWLEASDRVHGLIAESLHLQLDQFIEHADAIAGRAGSATEAKLLDPHELRIAGKALRYTLEMAIGGGHPLPARVTRSFKRMQDALGSWHDYVVLTDCALKLSLKKSISYHNAPVQLAVLDVARTAVQKAQRELTKFSTLWNANGLKLADTIRKAFPLPIAADANLSIANDLTESKMDPDPSHSTAPVEHPAEAPAVEPAAV